MRAAVGLVVPVAAVAPDRDRGRDGGDAAGGEQGNGQRAGCGRVAPSAPRAVAVLRAHAHDVGLGVVGAVDSDRRGRVVEGGEAPASAAVGAVGDVVPAGVRNRRPRGGDRVVRPGEGDMGRRRGRRLERVRRRGRRVAPSAPQALRALGAGGHDVALGVVGAADRDRRGGVVQGGELPGAVGGAVGDVIADRPRNRRPAPGDCAEGPRHRHRSRCGRRHGLIGRLPRACRRRVAPAAVACGVAGAGGHDVGLGVVGAADRDRDSGVVGGGVVQRSQLPGRAAGGAVGDVVAVSARDRRPRRGDRAVGAGDRDRRRRGRRRLRRGGRCHRSQHAGQQQHGQRGHGPPPTRGQSRRSARPRTSRGESVPAAPGHGGQASRPSSCAGGGSARRSSAAVRQFGEQFGEHAREGPQLHGRHPCQMKLGPSP